VQAAQEAPHGPGAWRRAGDSERLGLRSGWRSLQAVATPRRTRTERGTGWRGGPAHCGVQPRTWTGPPLSPTPPHARGARAASTRSPCGPRSHCIARPRRGAGGGGWSGPPTNRTGSCLHPSPRPGWPAVPGRSESDSEPAPPRHGPSRGAAAGPRGLGRASPRPAGTGVAEADAQDSESCAGVRRAGGSATSAPAACRLTRTVEGRP
jgi:hypothetical protein